MENFLKVMAELTHTSSTHNRNGTESSCKSAKLHDVKETSHPQNILAALKNFSVNRLLTDVTIWTETKIHVHKPLIQCFSSRLAEFPIDESCNLCIMVDDFYSSHIQSIVDIIYLGVTKVSSNVAQDICALKRILKSDAQLTSELNNADESTTYFIWPNYEEAIFQHLWKLRSDSSKCDVVFVTSNYEKSYTHSCILGACSDYLLNIFLEHSHDNGGKKPFVFILKNVNCEDLETVLEFCYRGSVQVIDNKVKSIFKIAELLGVQTLCSKLSEIDPSVSQSSRHTSDAFPNDSFNLVKKFHGGNEDEIRRSKLLQDTLSNLFGTESLVDVTFYVKNHKFKAHRVILSAFSKYFRSLNKHLELSSHVFVLVQDFRTHDLKAFLDYIYKGEALFCGTGEQFFASMLDWLDFDLMPINHGSDAVVASTQKTDETGGSYLAATTLQEEHAGATKDIVNIPKEKGNEFISCEAQDQVIESTVKKKIDYIKEVKLSIKDSSTDEDVDNDFDDENLSQMSKQMWEENKLTCQTCKRTFESRQQFREHLAVHPDARVVKCRFCNKGFDKPSQMKLHLRVHTGSRPFQCEVCGARFAAKSALTKHGGVHEKDKSKTYVCDICKKSFSRKEYIEEHLRTHSGNKPYRCSVCHKAFVGRTGLNHHMKTHDDAEVKKCTVCEICGKSFSRHALWTHMKSHNKSHSCEICGKLFATKTTLKMHVTGTHLGHMSHQCDVCGKGFIQKNHLVRHLKVHGNSGKGGSGPDDFTCEKCDKTFKTSSKLESHTIREHTVPGDRPYSCNICNKKFAGRSTVIYHRRAHTGERPHNCAICGKTFARPDALRQHLRSHASDKLFECQTCNTKFSSKGSLNKHMLTHKGEMVRKASFQCGECDKAFTSEKELTVHTQAHTSSRPHRCNFCRTSFRYVDSLVKHVQIHADSNTSHQIPPATELPGIFSFHVCGPPYEQCEELECNKGSGDSNNFCCNGAEVLVQDGTQFDITGATIGEGVCIDQEVKDLSSNMSRRPFSITMDGNLCCNSEVPPAAEGSLVSLVPALTEGMDGHGMQQQTQQQQHLLPQAQPNLIIPSGEDIHLAQNITSYSSLLSKTFVL